MDKINGNQSSIEINIDEFTDSYSDDLIYFKLMREAYITHPFLRGSIDKIWFDPFCCRMLSIIIVGNIEYTLKKLYEVTRKTELSKLFDIMKGGSIKTVNRNVKEICEVFKNNNIECDEPVIIKYLSIKNLRNAIAHSDMGEKKTKVLTSDNIPTNVMDLNENYINEFYSINQKLMVLICSLAFQDQIVDKRLLEHITNYDGIRQILNYYNALKFMDGDSIVNKLPKIEKKEYQLSNYKLYYDLSDLCELYWNNIEAISEEIVKTDKADIFKVIKLFEAAFHCWDNIKEIKNIDLESLDINKIKLMKRHYDRPFHEVLKDKIESGSSYINEVKSIKSLFRNYSVVNLFNLYISFEDVDLYNCLIEDIRVKEAVKLLHMWELKYIYISHEKGENNYVDINFYTYIMRYYS